MVQQQVSPPSRCAGSRFAAFVLKTGSLGTPLPLSQRAQRNKGRGTTTTRSIRSIAKQKLTRPTADGARWRRPKITGEAAVGLNRRGAAAHCQPLIPGPSASSCRSGEGRRRACPKQSGPPCDDRAHLRRLHYAQSPDDTLGESRRGALAISRLRACTNQPAPSCR